MPADDTTPKTPVPVVVNVANLTDDEIEVATDQFIAMMRARAER